MDGRRWLEWGYRLAVEARGKGYATEASAALLAFAKRHYRGDILGIIHPENTVSKAVIGKLQFEYWSSSANPGTFTVWESKVQTGARLRTRT